MHEHKTYNGMEVDKDDFEVFAVLLPLHLVIPILVGVLRCL